MLYVIVTLTLTKISAVQIHWWRRAIEYKEATLLLLGGKICLQILESKKVWNEFGCRKISYSLNLKKLKLKFLRNYFKIYLELSSSVIWLLEEQNDGYCTQPNYPWWVQVFKWHLLQSWQCPIHNCTLQTFIWSIMWKI